MKKLYYHVKPWYNPETKTECCVLCGNRTENGLSEQPCAVPTAARSTYGNYNFEVSVWNCKARLACFTEDEKGNRKYYSLHTEDSSVPATVDRLAEKSVYKAGGAINFSGIYPLCEELEKFLEEKIEEQKVVLK